MALVARIRRAVAVALTLAIVGAGLSAAPAAAAESSVFSRSALTKLVNQELKRDHQPKAKSNSYLTDYAQAWARKLAKSGSSRVSAPDREIPPTVYGEDASIAVSQCKDKRTFLGEYEFLITADFCIRNEYFLHNGELDTTHVGVGYVLTAKKFYIVVVYADYGDGIAKKLTSAKPSIKGPVRVGSTVTARTGAWKPASSRNQFTYEWAVAGEWVSDEQSYLILPNDKGKKITLIVTGQREGYWTPGGARSVKSKAVAAGVLVAKSPVVTGSRNVYETLTASVPEWSPGGVVLSYQWLRNGAAIAGQTEQTYELTLADLGKKVDVRVTGRLDAYTTMSRSTATQTKTAAQLLEATPVPVVTGDTIFGATLSVDTGAWQPDGVALAIQWRINGVAVKNATGETFVIPAAAVGKTITASVTGSKEGFAASTVASSPTSVIAPLEFATSTAPIINGTPKVGKKLTASVAAWEPVAALTYQWLRNGKKISGATNSTYVLTAASEGTTVTVAVTGTRAGYASATIHSAGITVK